MNDIEYEEGYYVVDNGLGPQIIESVVSVVNPRKQVWFWPGHDANVTPKVILAGPFTVQDIIDWQFEYNSVEHEAVAQT